jgi:hypothetical protein
MGELVKRSKIFVTLAAVAAAFVLGNYIPVLGFMPWPTDGQSKQQLLRLNIFAAGFTAWSSAWILFQVYELFKYWFSPKRQALVPVANPLNVRVLFLTLLVSGFMWVGLLQSFSEILFNTEITTLQTIAGVITGLAGTGLLFFLARCLNQVLPGFGFWGLLALGGLYGLANSTPAGIGFLASGAISPNRLAISALLFVTSVGAAVFLMWPNKTKNALTPHHIFAAIVLTAAVSPWLANIVFYLFENTLPQLNEMLPTFAKGQALQWILITASIILTLIFMSLSSSTSQWNARFWLSLLSIATIYLANELFVQFGGLPWPQLPILTLTFLAWCAHQVYGLIPVPPTSSEDDDVNFDDEFRRGWRN